jgi:putative membrane protein
MRQFALLLTLAFAPGLAGTSAAAPGPSARDRTFVTMAGRAGAAEIAAAKLALTKSTNPSTVAVAQRMIRNHTALAAKLKVAADAVGLIPPNAPSAGQAASIRCISRLNGMSFMSRYRQSQIAAHKGAIALFTGEAKHGRAPSLKSAATRALPLLKMHLSMAENIAT